MGDVGKMIWMLPEAVSGCDNLGEDIDAIKEWAEIFSDPARLGKTVSKNWIFHGVEIKKDIAQE